jgi:hypothetical protein
LKFFFDAKYVIKSVINTKIPKTNAAKPLLLESDAIVENGKINKVKNRNSFIFLIYLKINLIKQHK